MSLALSTVALWALLVGGALTSGAAIAGTLVVARRAEPLVAVAFLSGVVLSTFALVEIGADGGSRREVLWAVAFTVAATGGGYALVSSLLLEPAKRASRITIPIVETRSDSARRPLIILASCVEPKRYSAVETASLLADLADEGRLDASIASLPLLFFAQKVRYNAVGGTSPARAQLEALAERLEATLPPEQGAVVAGATCTGPGRLAMRAAQAVAQGYTDIVIAEPHVASGQHMHAGRGEVDALRLGATGVTVTHCDALGASERLAAMVASRIVAVAGEPDSAGVALVGHGQPQDAAHRDSGHEGVETMFMNRVRAALGERGFAQDRVRIAWAEWAQPDVTSTVRHLAALGCTRLVVSPAVHPFDGLQTMLDLDIAVRQARVDEETPITILPAWRDDPALVAELRHAVVDALREPDSI